jgi:hypothetical protein
VTALLKQGLDPNFVVERPPGCATSPLIEAVLDEELKIIEVLLAHHAAVTSDADKCGSALAKASWMGFTPAVKLLLIHGAKVGQTDSDGYTPLLLAASNAPDVETIKLLLAAGADYHKITKDKEDALMLAAWNLNVEGVKLFKELGLDPCVKNVDGHTARDIVEGRADPPEKLKRVLELLPPAAQCENH